MIDKYFTIIKQDINIIRTYFSSDDDKKIKDIDIKIKHAAIRLFNTGLMAIGIGIVFAALPIVSSGVSLVGLAIGVAVFIFGHDLFKLSQNWEALYVDMASPSYSLPFEQMREKMADELEEGTILRPLLKKTRDDWKPWLTRQFGYNWLLT